jgi:hypothetical protein
MKFVRPAAIGMLAALCLGFVALLARAALEGFTAGTLMQSTLSMLVVTGFLIVSGFVVVSTHGRLLPLSSMQCSACGSTMYLTVRSLDRRRLLTCFTCGRETVAA